MQFKTLAFQLLIFTAMFFMVACNDIENVTSAQDDPGMVKMLQRAKKAELPTEYSPPPGVAAHHHASGFAKILCSAVFITGLDVDFAAENIGYFTSPYEERAKVTSYEVDREKKEVNVTLPDGIVRTARYLGDQGCVCLTLNEDELFFTPQEIVSDLPDPSTTPWPMGDVLEEITDLSALDREKVDRAVREAFATPEGLTAGFIVTWKGQIIGEHYREGIHLHTPLESWSMGKSLTATLMGVLIQKGVYDIFQNAPFPEWQSHGDPRAKIRIADIMRMSSGLRFRAPQDPDFNPDLGYPDHLYVYTGGANSFEYCARLPQQWEPNTIGRYRNCDPVLTNYLVRLGVESLGEDYLSFPQKYLFDKLGIRDMVMETDPYGNYLLQGYEFGTPRDWARLGNLYLNDGVWNGERILPEDFADFVSTLAPAWKADGRPIYGAFFWINGGGDFPIPEDAYFMAGAGGQYTIIIPSHDLVVVKLSHYKGARKSGEDLNRALALLMEAVPVSDPKTVQ